MTTATRYETLPTSALARTAGWTRADRAAWARLCKRFPDLRFQLEHSVGVAAAQIHNLVNARITVGRTLGGWRAYITCFSPDLEHYWQRTCINDADLHDYPGEYPNRFDTLGEAIAAAQKELPAILKELRDHRRSIELAAV